MKYNKVAPFVACGCRCNVTPRGTLCHKLFSATQYQEMRDECREKGLYLRWRTHITSHYVISLSDVQLILKCILQYAEDYAVLLPARVLGYKQDDVQLLPSSSRRTRYCVARPRQTSTSAPAHVCSAALAKRPCQWTGAFSFQNLSHHNLKDATCFVAISFRIRDPSVYYLQAWDKKKDSKDPSFQLSLSLKPGFEKATTTPCLLPTGWNKETQQGCTRSTIKTSLLYAWFVSEYITYDRVFYRTASIKAIVTSRTKDNHITYKVPLPVKTHIVSHTDKNTRPCRDLTFC